MWRKKATPAPAFKQPAPYSPVTGGHAPLGVPGITTRLTMAQVIEDDTHDDYVVCQTWNLDTDPNCKYLMTSGVKIGKPYSLRGTFPYQVADILTVAKIRTSLGDTPGMASVSVGQPADLDEEIDILVDDDENPIAWMIVEGGSGGALTPRILYDDVAPGNTDKEAYPVQDDMTADTSADKVQVQNVFPGNFRGYGASHSGFDATTAAKIWTTPGPDGKEHIVTGKGLAKVLGGAAIVDGSKNVTGFNGLYSMDGGQLPGVTTLTASSTPPVLVTGWTTNSGSDGTLLWDEANQRYKIVDLPCKT